MTTSSQIILCILVTIGAIADASAQSPTPTPSPEGRVTFIVHEVQLLPEQADARPATLNDKVDDGTGVRTGTDSRSELTFTDLTITRLGANTIFSFNKVGRSVRLDSGAILLYARKNSGAAEISTKAVTVGITGTTVIVESNPLSHDRLIVLEGNARLSLNNDPNQSREVRRGQVLNVNAGAQKLPKPGPVNLPRIVKTHPLIKNFPPLPSLDLILGTTSGTAANGPPPPAPPSGNVPAGAAPAGGQPVSGGSAPGGGGGPVGANQPTVPYVPPPLVTSPNRPSGTPHPTATPRKTATPRFTPRPKYTPTPTPAVYSRAYKSTPTPTPTRKLPIMRRTRSRSAPGQIIR